MGFLELALVNSTEVLNQDPSVGAGGFDHLVQHEEILLDRLTLVLVSNLLDLSDDACGAPAWSGKDRIATVPVQEEFAPGVGHTEPRAATILCPHRAEVTLAIARTLEVGTHTFFDQRGPRVIGISSQIDPQSIAVGNEHFAGDADRGHVVLRGAAIGRDEGHNGNKEGEHVGKRFGHGVVPFLGVVRSFRSVASGSDHAPTWKLAIASDVRKWRL